MFGLSQELVVPVLFLGAHVVTEIVKALAAIFVVVHAKGASIQHLVPKGCDSVVGHSAICLRPIEYVVDVVTLPNGHMIINSLTVHAMDR